MQGTSQSQIQSLKAATRAMELQENVARTSLQNNESQVLLKVLPQVRIELTKRTKLSPIARLKKKKPCSLYDTLYDQVPLENQTKKSPPKLFGRFFWIFKKGLKRCHKI